MNKTGAVGTGFFVGFFVGNLMMIGLVDGFFVGNLRIIGFIVGFFVGRFKVGFFVNLSLGLTFGGSKANDGSIIINNKITHRVAKDE